MQPITYSLIFNLICAVMAAGLAYKFENAWLFMVVLMIQNHALERFIDRKEPEQEYDEDEPAIGFTANIK